ncbi:methyltransferase [Pseudorhodoplanes sp.]|uniref:methyltransferase n=1 Tax=Pseudorhodoplanes sp. TaxID=1934341 RepID=UPI002CF4C681|nr:methyltransferase [Pseudorhodoplanes sp.]HWV54566.1 methyltransferase [Pseudorhodoplanes sp.]
MSGGFAPAFERIHRLAYAYREAKVLLSAVELDVFSALSDQALDLESLRLRIGIDRRGARDFFDALVALRLLDRGDDGRYRNAPETAFYLDRTKSTYLGHELEFINASLYPKWASLSDSLRTGRPQTEPDRSGPYGSRYRDSKGLAQFAAAMTAATRPIADALAGTFPWSRCKRVVDIGCAEGCLPVRLAQSHAHLTVVGFDLPPIEPVFEAYVRKHALSDRVIFHPGDFLQAPLPAADVLVMGRVLHNWDLDTKKLLLAKTYAALSEGGRLIVYERFIDDERMSNATGLLASLNMLVMTPGGFDFTIADCRQWLDEAGFNGAEFAPLTPDQSMIVATK